MTKLFDKACKFAIDHHSGQRRKDGSIYILHPFEVATIASTMTSDEEVLSAAILHDTIEDANVNINKITKLFGQRVARYVELETEAKYENLSKADSWLLRKQAALKKLELINDINFKILYLSDKLANIRSLYNEFNLEGNLAFNKYNINDIQIQGWYYYSVLERLEELNQFSAYKEFEDKINYIFKESRKNENGKKDHCI